MSANRMTKSINYVVLRKFLNVVLMGFLFTASFVGVRSEAFAQTKARLDTFSSSNTIVQRLNCPAGNVQFARGVRWAPGNNKVSLTINDSDQIILPESCYAEMFCARFKGASSVVIVDTPACGGGAVGPEYIVIDLINKQKRVLNEAQFNSNIR
jgi:hypothetical protein